MAAASPGGGHPTPAELLPIFRACCSRPSLRHVLPQVAPTTSFSWRLFTPLIVRWCLIVQRLPADHTTDAVVSQLHRGAADARDPLAPHAQPFSHRLIAENSSAYVQGRTRLPLALLWAGNQPRLPTVRTWGLAPPPPTDREGPCRAPARWHHHSPGPAPDRGATSGPSRNQHGDG